MRRALRGLRKNAGEAMLGDKLPPERRPLLTITISADGAEVAEPPMDEDEEVEIEEL
jgi:hypothetical protein